jgi:hypothetical protein
MQEAERSSRPTRIIGVGTPDDLRPVPSPRPTRHVKRDPRTPGEEQSALLDEERRRAAGGVAGDVNDSRPPWDVQALAVRELFESCSARGLSAYRSRSLSTGTES